MKGKTIFFMRAIVLAGFLAGCVPVTGKLARTQAPESGMAAATATAQAVPSPTPLPTATKLPTATPEPTVLPQVTAQPGEAILLAAGDIADCFNDGDEQTAAILARYPDAVIAAVGDTVYEDGTPEEFAQCYGPSWGQFLDRTYPAQGNHEMGDSREGTPYYDYFGAAAGAPGKGYYSYDLGTWHIVVLNSNCGKVGGCSAGKPQTYWLEQDLASHPAACTLAYWHYPRFSSGQWGDHEEMEPIWEILYRHGAEIVLGGHDHNYERFKPIGLNGVADETYGMRQFVVGTGGKNLGKIDPSHIEANSEITDTSTYGILKISLLADSYQWEFIPAGGGTFTDSGEGACHPAPEGG